MEDTSDHLRQLKDKVLSTAEVSINNIDDCNQLKTLIEKKTGQHISEVALQRLFGFAPARFQPSAYTLDVLAKYSDYENEIKTKTQRLENKAYTSSTLIYQEIVNILGLAELIQMDMSDPVQLKKDIGMLHLSATNLDKTFREINQSAET
jgi:hypothetical protein